MKNRNFRKFNFRSIFAILAIVLGLTAASHAATFTSTQSGNWGSPATWGGAGIPGIADDVTIAAGTTVTLEQDRNSNNLTINSGGTLNLNTRTFFFANNLATFTNNGTMTGPGTFDFIGDNTLGDIVHGVAGSGIYSGNLTVKIDGQATVNVVSSTSMTFDTVGASINNQFSILNVTNPLTITGPASGPGFLTFSSTGAVNGPASVRTNGRVEIDPGTNATQTFNAPVEVVSGVGRGFGYFRGNFMIDGGASFSTFSASELLAFFGNLNILNGGTLDLNGGGVSFVGDQTTFTNNGSVINSGASNSFAFESVGGTQIQLQHIAQSSGTFSSNALTRVGGVTVVLDGSAQLGSLTIFLGTLRNLGTGTLTLSGDVTNNGTIDFDGGGRGCGGAKTLIRSSVPGTQRLWSGSGTFSLVDVDVKDQAGTVPIAVTGGINSGNNGANWTFAPCAVKSRADFDGDGKTDLSVFRPSEGNWYLNGSTAGFSVINWGISTDVLVPGDYDNDGKADVAVFRAEANNTKPDYYVLNSSTSTFAGVSWGISGDVPVSGDYDGDRKTDFAVFRPSTGTWYVLNSSNGTNSVVAFGASGDLPLSMDTDGDGKTNFAFFRPSTNSWHIAQSTGVPAQNFTVTPFGLVGDKLVPADYDGDNKDDIAVFRPSNGNWYILRSTDGAVRYVPFGTSGDVPVPGDYDGDGSDDVAVYRGGTWYINRSTNNSVWFVHFGQSGDRSVAGAYIP